MEEKQKGEFEEDLETRKDVLEAAIGPWGRWQAKLSFYMSLLKLPIAWYQLIILFLAPPTSHTCISPSNQTEINLTSTCSSYKFDRSVFTETIVTEWNLVGDRHQLTNISQMIFMFGVLVGNIVFGAAADRFGRKMPLMTSIVLQSLTGLAIAIVPWFSAFLLLRFLLATATGGVMVISFVICMENVGGRWRTIVPILYQIPFTLGLIMMSGSAYILRHWRHLQLALAACTLAFFAFYWLVPESPRWLLAMGRETEAAVILKEAAKMNRLDAARVDRAIKCFAQERKLNEQSQTRPNALFRTPRLRHNTILLIFIWLFMGTSFFGFSQFQGHLGGNIFANVAIAGLFGIPGPLLCVLAVRYLGRKKCIMLSLLVSGASCLLIAAVPLGSTRNDWARLTLAGISSFGLSVGFPALYLFSGELFPTVVRNAGMGVSSMSARLGSMVAPFLISLSIYEQAIPPVVLGLLPLFATALIWLLPETRGCVLSETIEDAEMFSRQRAKQDARNANYIRAPTSIPMNENAE